MKSGKGNANLLMETDIHIHSYPFAKVSMDASEPFTYTSKKGNLSIVSFLDWLANWIEAYAVRDKTAQTVINLLMNEIFLRFGAP